MKKVMALLGALMLVCVGGCSSDRRDDLILSAIDKANQTSAKIAAVQVEIDAAMKKAEKDPNRALELKSAEESCEALKKVAQELQGEALKIQREGVPTVAISEEERADLLKKFRGKIETEVARMNDESTKLNQKVAALEDWAKDTPYKKTVEQFKKRIAEIQGQYESLARGK